MDTNRIHSSASADAGQAASEASAHGTQMQPATLQFADATPPRDLVSGLANLRTHAAARAAADERQGAGASGSGNTSAQGLRPANIRRAATMLRTFSRQVASGQIDTQSDWTTARILSDGAFTEGRDAHAALKLLDKKGSVQFERSGDAQVLLSEPITAASLAIATYDSELSALRQRVRHDVRAASALAGRGPDGPDAILAIEPAYASNARRLEQMKGEVQRYRDALHEFVAPYCEPGAPRDTAKIQLVLDTASVGIASGHDNALRIDQERVKTQVSRIARYGVETDVLSRALELIQAFGKAQSETLRQIADRHQDPRATVSAAETEWLQAFIENVDGHADYFCLRASEQAQTVHPERNALLLDIAGALGSLSRTLDAIRSQPKLPAYIADRSISTTIGGQVLRRREDRQASAAESADQTSAAHDDWAVTRPVRRTEPPRARRTGKARAKSGAGTSASASGSASRVGAATQTSGPARTPSVSISEAARAAQARLRAFAEAAVLPETSVAAFLALGRQLGKDTAALELMADPASNPLALGHMMRSSIDSWWGNRAQWQRTKDALGPAPERGDDPHAQLRQALTRRIDSIDAVLAQVDTVELDLTKRYMFPKAIHVDKLLKAGAVASVSALHVLPPFDLADPNKGTTFSAEIQLRPTSDGHATPSLHLHLHTGTPVDAQTCRTLGFDELEAKHVKTERQSQLGRTWETFQRTVLGNDTRVHRGPMTPDVLAELTRRMRPQP